MRAWQFIKAQYVSKMNGWSQFISMQSHYNLINREEEREMIPFCESEGFGFTPWSPLARGKLASNNIMEENTSRKESDKVQKWLYDESSSNDRTIISTLQKISTEKGLSSAQVSLAWLLSKKVVSAPIIGCTTVRQLVDNVKSVELSLSPADIVELESSYLPHNTPELS
jgi:aryl-alcohol dehydrogenase-like predicted oxidoreductase